ncbi:MAG: hypothetical protein WDW38_002501 [Sanguina aurantia]
MLAVCKAAGPVPAGNGSSSHNAPSARGSTPSPGSCIRCPSPTDAGSLAGAISNLLETYGESVAAAADSSQQAGSKKPKLDPEHRGDGAAQAASHGPPPGVAGKASSAHQQQQTSADGGVAAGAKGKAGKAGAPVATPEYVLANRKGKGGAAVGAGGAAQAKGVADVSLFDAKTDQASAESYFHYYSCIMHQQNMLQDHQRTGTYYTAIVGNRSDFEGKVVMDVGSGSGILSLFAVLAGARKVYAVEASGMAHYARLLASSNPSMGSRIVVLKSRVEDVVLTEKVDILVSEPMGTLLVNERMLESYCHARDAFLKPGGKMFPQLGRIHAAAFSDDALYQEVGSKAAFWMQPSFYGIDVTSLYNAAVDSYFAQVVVDAFDSAVLVSNCATKVYDFGTVPEKALHDIVIPLQLMVAKANTTIHGIACWFDVFFDGADNPTWLSTAPGLPTTHWFQLRCVLKQPLFITSPNTLVTGTLRMVCHSRQSYDIHINLTAPPLEPHMPAQTSSGSFDLKDPFYRQLSGGAVAAPAGAEKAPAWGMGAGGWQ